MPYRSHSLLLVLALAALVGCAANTRLSSTYSDPALTAPVGFTKVLVVVASGDQELRRQVEGQISVMMKRAEGVPAYLAIPESAIRDTQKVKEILLSNNYDGVIVARLVSATQETTWVDTSYAGFWGYYGGLWPAVGSPGYLRTDTRVKLETKVYSLKDDKLVWAGMSSTFNPESGEQLLKDVAAAVAADMKAKGVIQ
jgi:hypothetical protein